MATLKTYPFPNSSILRLNSEKELINPSPDYQRQGGVWTPEKKQLLIDSILNDYDIPKLYFHVLNPQQKLDSGLDFIYAIIDGRQRIEAIWEFIDGKFTISNDFEYQADERVKAAGLSYTDLVKEYPKIKIRFDSYTLPVILVETEDIDLIEDMFSRLNEAVPLNSAEKRNSFGGAMARTIRELAENNFFVDRVAFRNNRYQHREVAARILFLEYSLMTSAKIVDTKKPYLDKMVKDLRDDENVVNAIYKMALSVLVEMNKIFISKDALLRAQAVIAVYYLIVKQAMVNGTVSRITRGKLFSFIDEIKNNNDAASKDIATANYDYLEFDRMTQQGTNDASSIKERTRILSEFLQI